MLLDLIKILFLLFSFDYVASQSTLGGGHVELTEEEVLIIDEAFNAVENSTVYSVSGSYVITNSPKELSSTIVINPNTANFSAFIFNANDVSLSLSSIIITDIYYYNYINSN